MNFPRLFAAPPRRPRSLSPSLPLDLLLALPLALGGCAASPKADAPQVVVAPPSEPLTPRDSEDGDPLAGVVGDPGARRPPQTSPSMAIGWCLRSRMCELEGMCSAADGGLCIAANDEDCEDSKACLGGRCSARGGLCVAANDEDCRESLACSGYGRCNFDGGEACMASADEDCKASSRCRRLGECRAVAGECVK